MKKKSILLTCIVAIMALAMFVGCDNAPVLPSFVVSGNITQTGDFLEGQNFDPRKFSVTITYDNGRIVAADDTVSVTLVDGGDTVSADDQVIAYLGKNYNSQDVYAKAGISVYPVNYIEVVAADKVYEAATASDISKADLTVTAHYINAAGEDAQMVIPGADYSVQNLVKDPEADKEASEVSATLTVSFGTETATTVITVTQVPEVIGNVASVDAIHDIQFRLGRYNYEELPEFDYSKVVLSVTMDETDTAGTTTLKADQIEGLVLSFVDYATKLPLDERAGQYNLADSPVNVGMVAEYNGEKTEVVQVNQYTPSITITSYVPAENRTIVGGADLPAIDPADYKVVLKEEETNSILTLTADDFFYADSATSKESTTSTKMPAYAAGDGNGKIYVNVGYQGVYGTSGIEFVASKEDPAEFTGIEATIDASKLTTVPAKQSYDAMPTMINQSALTVIASVDNGTTQDISSQGMNLTYYVAEGEPLEASDGVYDLSGLDQLLVLVSWSSFTDYVTVDLAEPVATGINIAPVYSMTNETGSPMYGATINWSIVANAVGGTFEYTGDYRVYKDDSMVASLPRTVADWTSGSYKIVIDLADGTTAVSNAVSAPTVVTYATVDNIDVALKDSVVALVGSKISDLITADSFNVVEGSWTPYGAVTAPVVVDVTPDYSDAKIVEGSNTVEVTISYNSIDGTTKTKTIEKSFEGVPYLTVPSTTVDSILYNGEAFTAPTVDTPYNVAGFSVDPSDYTAHGSIVPEIVSVQLVGGDTYTSGAFTSITAGQTYTFTFRYIDNSGDYAETPITFTANSVN